VHGSPLQQPQSGFFLKLADGVVTWTSQTQKMVALSSTEAEYMSISNCSQQCAWIRNLFMEIGFPLWSPILLFGDNQGSIFIAQNPVLDKRLKNINICFHYIQQEVQTKKVDVYFVEGSENPADMFTKSLT
jgi:hypothetical protein